MKSKTTKVRRYLAAILTVLMIFQQATTSVIYASSEAAVPTVTEAPAAQTEETPEKQVEETPEEKTPTEEENEGEKSAAPTEAPAENEAEPEVTVTPAAEPTATEAPAVEATPTPVPEATEVPEATPTEVPKKTEFSGTVDNAMATVSLSESISEDAVFVARQYADGDDYFDNAIDAAGSWLTANGYDGGQVIDAAVYDMHFEKNGQEIAVNQNATVNLQFIKPILTETVDGVPTSVHVLHIVNGTAVEAGSLNTDANGAVTVANINTNGFSPFVFVKTVNGDVTQTADNTETDLSKFFTSMTVSVDGTEVKDDTLVKPDSTFEFSIAFAESSSQNRMAQTVHFDMPNNLVNWAESGVLKEKGSDVVVAANYTVDQSGHVTVTFTDDFMSKAAQGYLAGDFYFKAGIKRTVEQEEVTITVPGTNLEKKIKFNLNASLEASKNATYDPVSGEITYTVTITAKEGEVKDINVTDTLGESLSLVKADDGKDYSLKIDEQVTTGNFVNGVATISSLKAGQSAVLTYKAKFKDGILNNFAEIDTSKTKNSVTAKGKNGSKDVISNTPEVNIGDQFKNYKWISKSGNVQDQNGKIYINWTVTYNESKLVSVKGNTVTDTIPENEGKISFKKNDKITVKRSDGKTFEITVPSDGKIWSYTIGSNSGDTYGNEKESYSYEFTYTTEIDANELADVYGNVTVQNGVSDDKGHSAQKDVSVAGKIGEPTKICTGVTAEKASWKVTIHVPASGMKFWFSDQVQQVTNNNGDWSRYGEIDPDSINITGTDNYYYQSEIDGRKTTGYLFFGADVGSQNTIQLNQANSQLPASINGAYDVIITYDTLNKYYKDQGRTEHVSMDADAEVKNTIKINGIKEISANVIIPGKFNVEKVTTNGYTDQDGKYRPYYTGEDNGQIFYVIKIDTSRSGLGNGNVTVTDTHSENLKYVADTAVVLRSTSTGDIYGKNKNDTSNEKAWVENAVKLVSEKGNKIIFELQNLGDAQKASDGRPFVYYLYYRMKIDDNLTTSSDGLKLTNTATVTKEGGTSVTTNTVSYNYKKPLLSKNQISLSNGYHAQFEITVPSATKYMTNGNLIVQDEYSNNLLIDNSSFGVTDQNGTPLSAGTEYSVTQNANGMQIEIKNAIDGNTYKIVYEAFVVGAPGVVINYTNTAYIPGHEEQYFKYTNSVTKNQVSGGSVGVQSYKFSIFKSGSDDQAVGLEGAEFTLYQGESVLTDTIKTGKDGKTGEIQSSDLNGYIMEPYIQYRLRETKAPDEYQILSEDIYFYFTNDSKSENEISSLGLKGTALYTGQTLNITNQKRTQGEVEYQFGVNKQVKGTDSCNADFSFALKDKDGKEIETVTTKGAGTVNFTALKFTEAGTYTYTVEETSKAPKEDAHGKWSYDNTQHTVTIEVVKNTETNTYEIKNVTGVDKDRNVVITNTYTEKTPEEVTYQLGVEKKVEGIDNCKTKFSFNLKDETGNVIETITTEGAETANFAILKFTKEGTYKYTVTETSQEPDADKNGSWKYDNTAHAVIVTVKKNVETNILEIEKVEGVDSNNNVVITNIYTKTKDVSVKISKVDADTYEVLGGAHLQVIDPDGKIVAEWDSDKDAYTLTDLKPGVVYTLHETAAPKGYKVAEDTIFQLNEDGTIDTANTTTAISDDTLLVKDEKKESKDVSVSVTKKLVTVDGTVIGAVDATYYVALYSDADCTERVSDVLALNFKNASSSTVTFTGLEKGQTYYVGECEADGTCYLANICADGTMYMVDFSDGNAVTVDNADGSTTVYFDNQFENIPDGYYKEAELNITKKLVGSDGKAKNSNEIFYAGIFADEGFTQLSTDVSQNIVPLDLAGGSEATALVNVALPESGSITLYVTEVDSNGKPVAGAASFKYDVTVDNAQVTLNDDNLSANVVITNTENSTKVTPTPGTPNTPNTPNTSGGFSGKSAVRTGDSTPIGGFIALFAAAAVIAGAAVFFKRRRKDEK